ncbi:MAG: peptidoglycan hydrolase CwlO-like protein [Gammaproteobacteria bacterium]|jgi:peptidoglycan hydrolase CwlO-like protein
MYKRTLVLFAALFFFTTAAYAEEQNLEDLQVQLLEIQSKLETLQNSNGDLKKTLASYENEIDGWRAALENIEAEIASLASDG